MSDSAVLVCKGSSIYKVINQKVDIRELNTIVSEIDDISEKIQLQPERLVTLLSKYRVVSLRRLPAKLDLALGLLFLKRDL